MSKGSGTVASGRTTAGSGVAPWTNSSFEPPGGSKPPGGRHARRSCFLHALGAQRETNRTGSFGEITEYIGVSDLDLPKLGAPEHKERAGALAPRLSLC